MSFHVGQTFGDYSITALLGAGGIGQVYRVEHSLTNRTETMKVLAELASDTSIKRFEREMRALARLSHPNIAALHNALQSENQLILLMEYIEGQTLECMFQAGRLPLETGSDISSRCCRPWDMRTSRALCIAMSLPRTCSLPQRPRSN